MLCIHKWTNWYLKHFKLLLSPQSITGSAEGATAAPETVQCVVIWTGYTRHEKVEDALQYCNMVITGDAPNQGAALRYNEDFIKRLIAPFSKCDKTCNDLFLGYAYLHSCECNFLSTYLKNKQYKKHWSFGSSDKGGQGEALILPRGKNPATTHGLIYLPELADKPGQTAQYSLASQSQQGGRTGYCNEPSAV